MATLQDLETELKQIERQRFELRTRLAAGDADAIALDRQLAQAQISLDSQITQILNSQTSNTYTVTQTGLNSWAVVDQTGRVAAIGRTPSEAIAQATAAGISSSQITSPTTSTAPAVTATESTGQTTTEAQQANAQGADPQAPNTEQRTVTSSGTVQPVSTNTASTTAIPPESGQQTTGTDGRLRTAQAVQSQSTTNQAQTPASDDSAGNGPRVPATNVATSKSDDTGGLNPVSAYITSKFDAVLSTKPTGNSLDRFSTYTYNLSIYMMTPEQYRTMLVEKKPSVAGLALLMNSGGVATADRNQYFPLDYYIDGVQLKTYVTGKGAMGGHTSTELHFRVTEPNGFTFIHNLVSATKATVGDKGIQNAFYNQIYLMVIRFQGFDNNGQLINAYTLGGQAGNAGVIEKFIPFRITGIKTRVANKLAEYDVSAVCPQYHVALGQQRGTVPYNIQLQATTLKDMLSNQLVNALNKFQTDLVDKGVFTIPDTYEIKLLPPLDDKSVTVVPPGDTYKPTTGMGPTPAAAPDKRMSPDKQSMRSTIKSMNATAGQSIVQFIDQTVRTSGYIYQQQIKYYDPTSSAADKLVIQSGAGKRLAWYRITTEAKPIKDQWDPKRNDYAYHIVYQVAPYIVTDSLSDYFPVNPKIPSIKVYNHWFTGENTQVIDYQQDYNNLFYWVVNTEQQPVSQSVLKNEINKGYQPNSNQSSQGIAGKVNEAGANAADRFYSPGDIARVKLTIVGDPDWIAQGDLWSGVEPYNVSATLPDGTINFASREPLFDVVYETPGDYDINQGIIEPPTTATGPSNSSAPRRERIVNQYLAYWVTHKFEKGKFTQELDGTLVFPRTPTATDASTSSQSNDKTVVTNQQTQGAGRQVNNQKANIASSPTASSAAAGEQDLSKVASVDTGTGGLADATAAAATTANATQTTITGGSAYYDGDTVVAPASVPEPPTSNGQDISVFNETPEPDPATGYVTTLPDGVVQDLNTGGYLYEGQNLVAGTNDALSAQVAAINTGNYVTYQDYDSNLGWLVKSYDPQSQVYSIIGSAPDPYQTQTTTASAQTMAKEY